MTGVFILLVTFFLLPFLFALPKCILSVIICVVVFSILAEAPHDVKVRLRHRPPPIEPPLTTLHPQFFWKMRAWIDLALMALTFFLSILVNVEVGILVSVAVSMLLCIRQSAAMRVKILGRVPGTQFYEPLDELDDDDGLLPGEEIPGVLIVRLRDVSLTFANAGALKERLRRLERYGKGRHHPSDQPRRAEASVLVFHLADVEDIDASALQVLLELVESYASRSVLVSVNSQGALFTRDPLLTTTLSPQLYWTAVNATPLERLHKAGVIKLCGGGQSRACPRED